MGVRDRLDRIAAWFGFGVTEDDYYEDEEEEDRRYANDAYGNGSRAGGEPGPTVPQLGRSERSSAFGTSSEICSAARGRAAAPTATPARISPPTCAPSPTSGLPA